MQVIKHYCDRCGKEFDFQKGEGGRITIQLNDKAFSDPYFYRKEYEFCEDCAESLEKYVTDAGYIVIPIPEEIPED